MREKDFRAYMAGRRARPEQVESAVKAAMSFEAFLAKKGASIGDAGIGHLQAYVSELIKEGRNSEEELVAVARYCRFAKRNGLFIHIAGLVNGREVPPGIERRLGELEGDETRSRVFEGLELPPLGAPQEAYAPLTRRIVQRMQDELPAERCKEILTWNYHGIPVEAFLDKKERFEKAASIDEFLEEEHRRFVEELSRFMRNGEVWYEQEITPAVVEFAKADQEICIGRREGERIFITKIPFAPDQYLRESDPRMKRYLACHCPLARSAILEEGEGVPAMFCHCSAGFEKLPYDVVFGEPVEVEVLESVLRGDMRCRFAIRIPEDRMK